MVKGRDGDMAEIYFPYTRLMKAYQNSGNYPGLGIEYEVLPKEITESDDPLQWIKDVKTNPWDGKEFKVVENKYLTTTGSRGMAR
jgi:hypothetical protein